MQDAETAIGVHLKLYVTLPYSICHTCNYIIFMEIPCLSVYSVRCKLILMLCVCVHGVLGMKTDRSGLTDWPTIVCRCLLTDWPMSSRPALWPNTICHWSRRKETRSRQWRCRQAVNEVHNIHMCLDVNTYVLWYFHIDDLTNIVAICFDVFTPQFSWMFNIMQWCIEANMLRQWAHHISGCFTQC